MQHRLEGCRVVAGEARVATQQNDREARPFMMPCQQRKSHLDTGLARRLILTPLPDLTADALRRCRAGDLGECRTLLLRVLRLRLNHLEVAQRSERARLFDIEASRAI